MYEKLTLLLKKEQEEFEEERLALSKRQSNIREVYDRIKPKSGSNIITDKFLIYLDKNNKDKLKRCIDEIGLVDDLSISVLNKTIYARNEYIDYINFIKSENDKAGIPNNLIFTEKFKYLIDSLGKKELSEKYNQIYETKIRLDSTNKDLDNILIDISNRIINEYELILKEKEIKKENIKIRKYILKKLSTEERLFPNELSLLTNIIDECEDPLLKNKLQEELNHFNEIVSKKNNIHTIKLVEVKKEYDLIPFIDLDRCKIEEQEKEDKFVPYKNHLSALKELSNKEEVFEYLDSIKYMNNFDIVIIRMMNSLEDNTILEKILEEYLSRLEKVEIVDTKNENNIFYYGVTHDKNYILNDLKSIPEELYSSVKTGINNVKTGKFSKSKTIQAVKKINKIRIGDIRIAYKRIGDSNYIIVGVYLKKDAKGYDIIRSIKSRETPIMFEEQAINDAINSKILFNTLQKNNIQIEDELMLKLKSKVK